MQKRDPALDTLLDLDGLTLVVARREGIGSSSWSLGFHPRQRNRTDWIIRSRSMEWTAKGWSDSITPIVLGNKSAAVHRTIAIACEP